MQSSKNKHDSVLYKVTTIDADLVCADFVVLHLSTLGVRDQPIRYNDTSQFHIAGKGGRRKNYPGMRPG